MKKDCSLCCALINLSILAGLSSAGPAIASSMESDIEAKITEARGDVFKRDFADEAKEKFAEPMPAKRGDRLKEGMQVGTGDKSWAQLQWKYISARAWANSLYAIAPNQRLVYLTGGEMLYQLNKHRKDKNDYFVWTKLIQARIRGTTVLFQTTADTTRVTVLEGCIDVMNRTDRSIVRLKPGVVYEVKELHPEANTSSAATAVSSNMASTTSSISAGSFAGQVSISPTDFLHSIALNKVAPVQLFETKLTISTLYLANPQSLLSHPLLTVFELPLASLDIINNSLGSLLPKIDNLFDGSTGELLNGSTALLNKNLLSEAKVIAVPRSLSYRVGPAVGQAFTLPQGSVSFFPPSGVIGQKGVFGQSGGLTSGVGMAPGLNENALRGRSLGLAPTVVPGVMPIAGSAGLAGVNGGSGGLGTVGGGIVTEVTGVSGLGAAVPGGGGAVGLIRGGGGSGIVNGLTGSANTLLQNTSGGLGKLLGGTTGALGLPLGH